MKAMILAAGLGTRLRPLTDYCPKPLLPLMLRPGLDHLLRQLRAHGVREVIVNTHHHAAQLAQWLGDGSRWGLHLTLSYEDEILGTAGALKRVAPHVGDAPFLVMNADVLADVNLSAVWQWHCAQRDAMVTMVLRPDPAARAYGPVVVDAANRVRHINGRPAAHRAAAGEETIFTGIQVVDPQVLSSIPPNCFVSTTADIYPALLARHEAVYGYRHVGYWMDMGVPERYRQAHWDLLDGVLEAPWAAQLPPGSRVIRQASGRASGTQSQTIIPPVVLGPDVTIAPEACVGPYVVLGAGCHVATGARIQESIIGEHVQIEEAAHVQRSILGQGVQVPAAAQWIDVIHST